MQSIYPGDASSNLGLTITFHCLGLRSGKENLAPGTTSRELLVTHSGKSPRNLSRSHRV